jgi:beta-lactam-binding protein with PASTA domain
MRRGATLLVAVLVVGCMAVAAGCGSSTSDSGSDESTVVTQTVTEQEPAADDSSAGSSGESSSDDIADDDSGSGKITVPDVVGKDHQLAQDTMQAAGLYNLNEEDATGQGRLLIIDRNWTVVRQDPPAGSKVSEDEEITLYSKKDDE